MANLHVKKGDTVVVLSGNSKGVKGEVIATSPEEGKVIVAGANVVSKHKKARKQGEESAIIKTEAAMYACKVQIVCPKCDKGVRTKVVLECDSKARASAKCGHKFD